MSNATLQPMTAVPAIQLDRLIDKLEAMRASLEAIEAQTAQDEPQDYDRPVSDVQEIRLELYDKRHLFVLAAANLNILVRGYATPIQFVLQAGVWFNLSFPEGSVVATTGQGNTVNYLHFRATNETQP